MATKKKTTRKKAAGKKKVKTKAGTSRRAADQKRKLFIEAYCTNGGNGTQAVIAAGWSAKTARVTASKLLTDANILAEIEKRNAEVLAAAKEKTQLTADEVLESLARDIRFDPAKLYDEFGNIKSIHAMDEDTRLALRGMDVQVIGKELVTVIKAKFPEKTSAREQGMKHFGLYEKDNTQRQLPNITFEIGTDKE